MILFGLLAACALYYGVALFAAFRRPGRSVGVPGGPPAPVSVLKPVRGAESGFYDCIRSFADQQYPEFEILFGVRDPGDPAISEIRRVAAEFPHRRIEIVLAGREHGPNAKVSSLEALRREARHEILVVSDADVRVGPDYLNRVAAPLVDPEVGLVTCPYRGVPGGGLPSLLEALWISTDFQVGVLAARLLGIRFALGASMAFRQADLERIGGFVPLAGYLADDYHLGLAISGLGRRIVLSDYVVETVLPCDTWAHSWTHRLRWGRTLRVCRPGGYAGALITFAVPLALFALVFTPALWPLALACVALRFAAALVIGRRLLGDRTVVRWWPLLAVSDLLSLAVWLASLFGHTVVWRGDRFRLRRDGRIARDHSPSSRPARSSP